MLSAILFSIADVMRKKFLFKLESKDYTFVFLSFSALFVMVYLPYVSFNLTISTFAKIFILACLVAAGNYFLFISLKHFEISTVIPFFNLEPLILLFLAFVFLGETILPIHIIGIILILVGGYALESLNHFSIFHPIKTLLRHKYQRYILLFVAIFGISRVIDKHILNIMAEQAVLHPNYTLAFFGWIFTALIFAMFYASYNNIKKPFTKAYKKFGISIALPSLLVVLGSASYLHAASLHLISLVVPIIRLSTLFGVIFGGKIFHERHLWFKIFCCIIMVIGTFFVLQ